jgi:hypothetical protein
MNTLTGQATDDYARLGSKELPDTVASRSCTNASRKAFSRCAGFLRCNRRRRVPFQQATANALRVVRSHSKSASRRKRPFQPHASPRSVSRSRSRSWAFCGVCDRRSLLVCGAFPLPLSEHRNRWTDVRAVNIRFDDEGLVTRSRPAGQDDLNALLELVLAGAFVDLIGLRARCC